MMKEPSFENRESPEKRVSRLLREKGIENKEAHEALIKWTIDQEKAVENSTDPEASILFNVRRACLYLEAGYIESSLENFYDAAEQAYQERRDELCEKIEKEAEEISKSLREK